MQGLAAAILAAFGILLAIMPAARADTTKCVGDLGNANIIGDLAVPDGASCTLRDVTVTGSVTVGHGAALRLFDGVMILRDLRMDHCDFASFEPSSPAAQILVGGSVEFQHCTEASGKLFSAGRVAIGGNFACRDNAAPCIAVSLTIAGNALVERNAGGLSYIEDNTIGGNLECAGNIGVTDYGSRNTVAGKKLGQCAGLP